LRIQLINLAALMIIPHCPLQRGTLFEELIFSLTMAGKKLKSLWPCHKALNSENIVIALL
jgi:hypothetical protein